MADSNKSDDNTVVMVENACAVFDTGGAQECVNGNDPDLITASIDVFAEDRVTALAVSDKNLPADAVPHEGLVNKFPFDVQKKTYPFWDGDVGRAVDIDYKGTKTLFGLKTYEYPYTIKDVPINIADDDPATPEDDAIPGTYDNVVTVCVDPKTGSIVKSGQHQQQFLDDGTPAADVDADPDRRLGEEGGRRRQGGRQPADHPADGPPDRRVRRAASCACSAGSSCMHAGALGATTAGSASPRRRRWAPGA